MIRIECNQSRAQVPANIRSVMLYNTFKMVRYTWSMRWIVTPNCRTVIATTYFNPRVSYVVSTSIS